MHRRYLFATVGLTLAIVIAAPVFGAPSATTAVSKKIKAAISKEVSKQLANKTGPPGPTGANGANGANGTNGATGPRGPSDSFIKMNDPAGFLTTAFTPVVAIASIAIGQGDFAITGTVNVIDQINAISNNGNVDCRLMRKSMFLDVVLDSTTLEVGETEGGKISQGELVLVSDSDLSTFPGGSSIEIQCRAASATANVNASGTLRMIEVENRTVVP